MHGGILSSKLLAVSFSLGLSAVALGGAAQAATPSEAFQRAEHLGKLVERLLESDLMEGKLSADPPAAPSRPRHVLRLANFAYENIQYVKSLNGLAADPQINTQAKETKPQDVINVLEAAIKSTKALGPVYSVNLDIAAPAVVDGKKPSEVLARLRAVNADLVKLGAPKTLPNDVYRITLGIYEQASSLTKSFELDVPPSTNVALKASPADALKEAIALINDLDKLSKSNQAFALPNGVITPPTPQEGQPVTPSDVLLATQFALADLYSLKVKTGGKDPLLLPPAQAGRNPADVKNRLAEARRHINALIAIK